MDDVPARNLSRLSNNRMDQFYSSHDDPARNSRVVFPSSQTVAVAIARPQLNWKELVKNSNEIKNQPRRRESEKTTSSPYYFSRLILFSKTTRDVHPPIWLFFFSSLLDFFILSSFLTRPGQLHFSCGCSPALLRTHVHI